jgi:hypothetical protein
MVKPLDLVPVDLAKRLANDPPGEPSNPDQGHL